MQALILAEHNNKLLNPSTLCTLTAATKVCEQITVLVLGHQCTEVAHQVSEIKGVDQVLLLEHENYEYAAVENIAEVLLAFSDNFDYFFAPATTFGKNVMPRVAAKLDVMQVSDITKVINHETFEHPVYAGNAIETIKLLDAKKVLTVRTTAFEATEVTQSPARIEHVDKTPVYSGSEFVSQQLSQSERPDLSSAKTVVSGGRGLQSAEKFKLIEELADALDGAVGASRAAVDAGYVSNDYQVGQTGKVVAPSLYIAVGISGAVQHLAGMKDSKVIVAINKDEDAPIFQIADYGLVGDLFEIVPELIQKIKNN